MGVKVGDVVTLRRTSPEIVAASNGVILKYVGHAGKIIVVSSDIGYLVTGRPTFAVEFGDGAKFWVSMDMLRK